MPKAKRMVSLMIILAILFSWASSFGQNGLPLTLSLDKSIELALKQSKKIQIADENLRKAQMRIQEAESGAFPSLSISGLYNRNWIIQTAVFGTQVEDSTGNMVNRTMSVKFGSENLFNFGMSLQQAIYSAGRVGTALQIARIFSDFSGEQFTGTKEDVVYQVQLTFYGALLTEKLTEVTNLALKLAEDHLNQVKLYYEQGTVSEYDLLRAQVEVDNLKPALSKTRNVSELALAALKNIIGLDPNQPVVLQGQFEHTKVDGLDDTEALFQKAISNRSEVKQMRFQKEIAKKAIRIAQSGSKPSLYLIGSYQWQAQTSKLRFKRDDWHSGLTTGLSLQLPIFDGWRTKAQVDQAKSDVRQLEYTEKQIEDGIKLELKQAVLTLKEVQERIESQEKTVEQAERGLQIAELRYKNGLSTQLEIMDSQLSVTQAKTNYVQALYDQAVAIAKLQKATGTILTGKL